MAKEARKAVTLPDDEREALAASAIEIAGRQGEERATDSLGRSWLFRVDRQPIAALWVEVSGQPPKGPAYAQGIHVPMSTMGADDTRADAVAAVVGSLDAAAGDALAA